nr:MAG TPA: hypothetical protein [Caudoviricetes sp.]
MVKNFTEGCSRKCSIICEQNMSQLLTTYELKRINNIYT